jgi:DNA-binding HxlR family transcriptional regulator
MAENWLDSEPVVRLLAGRWTLAVLSDLASEGRRYQDLHTALGAISHKVPTDTLRRAERDGLVARIVDRNRVETATLYQLTALAGRANRNWDEVETCGCRILHPAPLLGAMHQDSSGCSAAAKISISGRTMSGNHWSQQSETLVNA